MNKSDLKLLLFSIVIIITFSLVIKLTSKEGNIAKVYYEDKEVLKINLSTDNTYTVDGFNGEIKIIVKDNKIKVDSENSPLHICSKQGYISSSNEVIVCLPNKIVIKIEDEDELDGVVG